ncbi:MAG: Nif3-like dinuclear metal center hexameric protein [Prevotellaceae bacterium]|nr:Nif3-like dinuclear metal center hexameric protein [Prevotellaceae bacterium]MDO4932067.1 Nif3-like dinuclear metal center hexameric protein [Prevotellaceae bacterium]
MKIKDVTSALECFAPLPLQEDYDNAGLQVGLTEAEVSGVLLCLDVTEDTLQEAIDKGCNMIVAHHPLIFRRLKRISNDDYVQRCVMKAIKNDITIVAMHTNLDSVNGGVNYMIARKLGLHSVEQIEPHTVCSTEAGCGVIGLLPSPITAEEFITTLKGTFNAACVMTNQLLERPISKIAICGGSGAFVLPKAIAAGADAFITGEMHYHEFFGQEQKIQIAVMGHYESEQFTINLLEEIIKDRCSGVRTVVTEKCTNPIIYH